MIDPEKTENSVENDLIENIYTLEDKLLIKFENNLKKDENLTRQLVSFQANKKVPFYRWYKYKEGFSSDLVNYYFNLYGMENGNVLDPFAGSGTTLFSSFHKGLNSTGIELLPIGIEIMETRKVLMSFSPSDFDRVAYYIKNKPWNSHFNKKQLNEINITQGAYSAQTKDSMEKYLDLIENENHKVKKVLLFGLLCILENISYTRKDGQYLRWDYRSSRKAGKTIFNKGKILEFDEAISEKLSDILEDTSNKYNDSLFPIEQGNPSKAEIDILCGSSLEILPTLESNYFDFVITSPPYANRYDYTRTYALELALLGIENEELKRLRQAMLSCTVENKEKDLTSLNPNWKDVIDIVDKQDLLQEILIFLEYKKSVKALNNPGISRMIKGYFYELSCVIYELFRTLKKNGVVIMVNDNVRYAGVCIPVDLILSDIAQMIGFSIERISVLPSGKGNSSQQMGSHGRTELRKCVYVWRKLS